MRKFVFPTLIFIGFDRLLLGRKGKSACIINFHGVRKNPGNPYNNRHIPVAEFEKILIHLKKRFEIVSLTQLFDEHRNKSAHTKKRIALTFDDGYLNNFELALPLLKKHKIPATFYIITKGLEDKSFYVWPDKLDAYKQHNKSDIVIKGHSFSNPAYFNNELNLDLIDFLKAQGNSINDLIDSNLKPACIDMARASHAEIFDLVRAEELSKFKDETLIEFGSHTHSHPNLEFLTRDEAFKELSESKQKLENLLQKKISSIAFPDGSYSAETLDVALEAGYQNLVAVSYKLNENNGNPNLLSRFTISNSTTAESNLIRLAKDFDLFGF